MFLSCQTGVIFLILQKRSVAINKPFCADTAVEMATGIAGQCMGTGDYHYRYHTL